MEALERTYTENKSLRDKLQEYLTKTGTSITAAANSMGYSRSAISQYLNGKYVSDTTELEKKVQEYLGEHAGYLQRLEDKRARRASREAGTEWTAEPVEAPEGTDAAPHGLPDKVKYFESTDFMQIIGLCHTCQQDGNLGIVVGRSGQGKTHALKKYSAMPRVAYVECDDTMGCRDLVEAIETQVGLGHSYGGSIWKRVNRIREFFNVNTGYLLIVDEADKLVSKYTQKKMEILRGIFDQSQVGLVVAGEPRLEGLLKGNLERFANRLDLYYKLKGLTTAELAAYLEPYEVDEDAANELALRALGARNGCFRLFDRTMNNCRRILEKSGKTRITMKVIAEASSLMML